MSKNISLIFLILAIAQPCLMAPLFWTEDDHVPSHFNNNDDDNDDSVNNGFFNIFGSNNEQPESNLIITPNGIFVKTEFHVNPFANLFTKNLDSDEDSLTNFSPDVINNPRDLTPFYVKKHFTFEPDVNIDNDEQPELEEPTINEAYLKDLINTISLLHKITEIVKNIDQDDTLLTNDDNNNGNGMTFVGSSAKNPNVDIKITFDKFDDGNEDDNNTDEDINNKKNDEDLKDDSDEMKTTNNDEILKPELKFPILDEIFNEINNNNNNNKDLNNKKDDSDEIRTTNDDEILKPELKFPILDEIFKEINDNDLNNKKDNSDEEMPTKENDEILRPELKFQIPDEIYKDLVNGNGDLRELLTNEITKDSNKKDDEKPKTITITTTTTTARPTEWDESEELNDLSYVNKGLNSEEENFNFVPAYDDSNSYIVPEYKIVY